MSYARIKSPPLGSAPTPQIAQPQSQYPPTSHPNDSRTPLGHSYTSDSPTMSANQPKSKLNKWLPHMYPTKPKPMSSTRRRKLLFSYAPDWVITILLAAAFFALDKVDGYRRLFSLSDTSLRHPYAVHERVPNEWLYVAAFVVPIVLQPIINFFTVRSWWDLHNSSLGLVLGLALTGATTQLVKITVGRPRPDIVDRCNPPEGLEDPVFGLTSWTACVQPDAGILRDGFRSFPSGHSSMSFAGLGFLSFYLAGKLHLFDTRGHAGKAWISLFPFFGAAMVAISRSMDYRHHWHDILVGSLLGIFFSYFAYRQYYPPLHSEVAHRPYSPRIAEASEPALPTHMATANTTAYNPNSHRYDYTPSPPLQQQPYKNTGGEYETVTLGVDGTVPRPGQGSMEEVWKEGANAGLDGTIPRSREESGTREQQLHFQEQNAVEGGSQQEAYSIPLRTTSHHANQQQQYGRDAYTGIQ